MPETACPHCHGMMQNPPELAGKWVACPHCRQQLVLSPPGQMTSYTPPAYGSPPHTQGVAYTATPHWLNGIKVPILIAGILNSVWAFALLISCYGAIFSFPLVVLCVFEFVYFGTADRQPASKAISDGRVLGILEIIAGVLTCSPGVFTCGILAVVNANQAERQVLMGYP